MRKLYNWQEWFDQTPGVDGKVRFVLNRGEHYNCSQSTMSQQLRIAATHCGVRVSVMDLENQLSVVVMPRTVATCS